MKNYSKRELSTIRRELLKTGYPTYDQKTGKAALLPDKKRRRKTLGVMDERLIRQLGALGRDQ